MGNNLDELMKRTSRYFYNDGLVELVIGGSFLTVVILLQLWARAAFESPLLIVITIGLVLLVSAGGLAIKRTIDRMKELVTYPRTGYVSYPQRQPGRGRWLFIAVAGILAVFGLVLPELFSKMALAEGLLLLVVLGIEGYRVGVRRFYLVGIIAMLLGLGAALLIPEDLLGSSVTFGGTGLALLISGALTLRAYLQAHPVANEDIP